ncbi:MAG TPA: outer membrane beta-barrel protein [Gammaproteobacteria bacterium]
MNKLYSTVLFLGLAAVAGSASAANNGWYVGVDLGQSKYDMVNSYVTSLGQGLAEDGLPNNTSESDTATAYGVDVGYQFMRYFAVEGGYVDFGSATGDVNITLAPPGDAHVSFHAKGETLFAVGILPVSDNFSLFGKLGILAYSQDGAGSVSVESTSQALQSGSHNGTTTGIGVGANFDFNSQFGLRLGFTRFHSVGDVDNNSAAIMGEGTIDMSYLQFLVHF